MDKPSTSQSMGSNEKRHSVSRRPVRVGVTEPNYVQRITRMLNEEIYDSESDRSEDDVVDDSDEDPDFVLPEPIRNELDVTNYSNDESESSSDTEEEPSIGNIRGEPVIAEVPRDPAIAELQREPAIDRIPQRRLPKYIFGRLRKNEYGPTYYWITEEPRRDVRTPARNIVRGLPGLTGTARALGNNPSRESVWKLLFDENIVQLIVENTNVKLTSVREKLGPNTEKSNYRNTDVVEINAYIGLLLYSSILKSSNEKMESLFSKDVTGRPLFTATMSAKRFELLTSCLRFDDVTTRLERKSRDKAAAITEIFQLFIENSKKSYSVSEYLTVDEMLVPFRGRCGFKVYMPKKPKKYGVKIMCLCDSKSSYLYNAYIYTGAGSDGQGLSEKEQELLKPTQSLVKLCKPVYHTNKNITADNYFSSIEAADVLGKLGLTYVGTMRKDKLVIPREFLPDSKRPVESADHAFNDKTTLVSYVPKKNKAVILISTMHNTAAMNEAKRKPEIICFYNETKCGVDLIDMRCAIYSSNRRTRRWPLSVFYRMVNIGSVNSYIIYLSYKNSPVITRFQYIKNLARDLVEPLWRQRLAIANLPRDIKGTIKRELGEEDQERAAEFLTDKMNKRKTCSKCPWEKKRKTQYACVKCSQPICLECSRKMCLDCATECVQ